MALPTETMSRDLIAELRTSVLGAQAVLITSSVFLHFDNREVWPWGDKVIFPSEPYDDGSGALVAAVRYQKFGWKT